MSGGFISSLFKKKAAEEEPSKFGLARVFKYEELKKATNNFNTELGSGGFGRVYLGKLRDGQMVAVKVLYDRNPKRLEQFFNEAVDVNRDPEDIYLDAMVLKNKKLEELVDSKLAYHSNDDVKRMINSVAELAMECLQPKGDMRPAMVQVVTVLKGIQNEMQQIGLNDIDVLSFHPQQELGECSLNKGQDRESSDPIAFRVKPPWMVLPMEIPTITLAELNRLTGDFGQKAYIGEGSHFHVFYAVLSTGEPAAIKKSRLFNPSASHATLMDFTTVSRLKHEYFVQLLGYCIESNNQILVYQFATKGSLHDILHGVRGASPGTVLSWSQRVNIALGVSSSRVLLFDDYKPKIADFYLTREYFKPRNHADLHLVVHNAYDAPEYVRGADLTKKCNSYSFGVILLELLTGRKPFDPTMPSRQMHLVAWARPRLSEDKVQWCVDPKLNNEYPPKAAAKMAAIAALCIQYEPDFRPDMSIIVKALLPLLKIAKVLLFLEFQSWATVPSMTL